MCLKPSEAYAYMENQPIYFRHTVILDKVQLMLSEATTLLHYQFLHLLSKGNKNTIKLGNEHRGPTLFQLPTANHIFSCSLYPSHTLNKTLQISTWAL